MALDRQCAKASPHGATNTLMRKYIAPKTYPIQEVYEASFSNDAKEKQESMHGKMGFQLFTKLNFASMNFSH